MLIAERRHLFVELIDIVQSRCRLDDDLADFTRVCCGQAHQYVELCPLAVDLQQVHPLLELAKNGWKVDDLDIDIVRV